MTPQLGVCYYPEHWPEAQWAQDAKAMVELGLSWVRIGEFAWSKIEPRAGEFDWGWLDRAVEILHGAGLKIVMGTPSATPPRWMLDIFPDMLAWDVEGRPRGFGSRRHYDFSHLGYRRRAAQMAGLMAERYADYVAVWQTDNEYGCHDTVRSYSPVAKAAFQNWLAQKYETIDALNQAWGTVFWSMDYSDFSEIGLPNLTVTEPHPAHGLDYRRFASDQVLAWDRAQVAAIRTYSDAPISHNYMGRVLEFDHFALGQHLEIATWDSYPLGFLEDRVPATEAQRLELARHGDPDFQAFHHDLYRAIGTKGRWWVMEQQPGPVNWAPWNPAPAPGQVKLWSWEAIAHGAEVVSYFRWRQAPFAQEQNHAGLCSPAGAPRPVQTDIAQLRTGLTHLSTAQTPSAPIAIVFDYTSQWAWETQPQGADFDAFELAFDLYRALRRQGYSVDILPPKTDDFGTREAVFIPGLFAWTPALEQAVAAAQCPVVLGPRTGTRDANFQIPASADHFSESLRPGLSVAWEGGGAFTRWRDLLPERGETLIKCADGHPALLRENQTEILTLCGWPDATGWSRLLQNVGLDRPALPGHIRCRMRGDMVIWMNYGPTPDTVEIDGTLVTLAPAEVVQQAADGTLRSL